VLVAWRKAGPMGDVALVLAGAMLGLFLTSFLSESASGLLGNAPYFIFAGWMLALALPVADRLRFVGRPKFEAVGSPLDASSDHGDTITR
jgi:hypothetical protein